MNKIKRTFINALLADAVYVNDLVDGYTGEDLRPLLEPRMTPTLALHIANNFEVVSHINKSDDLVSGGSGFDATGSVNGG